MRCLLAVLIMVLLAIAAWASADANLLQAPPASAPPSYTPLCGGTNPACAYAYSTERQMVSGATTAFVVQRSVDSTNQNIGFITSGPNAGFVDTSQVDAFCNHRDSGSGLISRNCYLQGIVDQTGNSCLVYNSTAAMMPDYMVAPQRGGLPQFQKPYQVSGGLHFLLDSNGGSTGALTNPCTLLTGGAQGFLYVGNDNYVMPSGGQMGLTENTPASGPAGAMFAAATMPVGAAFDTCINSPPLACAGVDTETYGMYGNYTRTANGEVVVAVGAAGGSGVINGWVNNSLVVSHTPGASLVTKSRMTFGAEGDHSQQGSVIARDLAMFAVNITSGQATALYNNEEAFVATLTQGYQGPGDIPGLAETSYSAGLTTPPEVQQMQWLSQCLSLRKCYAAYEGPALNVCQGTGACEDIGWVNNTIDTATMSAYCGPGSGLNNCTVQVWYNQALNQDSNTNGVGTGIDATTASTRPVVLWSGCGTSAITVCIQTDATHYFTTGGITVTDGYAMSAVAMRTSSGGLSTILSSVSSPEFIGFAGAANTCVGAATNTGPGSHVACNDNSVHSITVDAQTSPSASTITYADGTAGTADTSAISYSGTGLGVGATGAGVYPCICQLSEVLVFGDAHNTSFNTALGASNVALLRANQQAAFGF